MASTQNAVQYSLKNRLTVNDESLKWLMFGKSGFQTFWWIKVWQIHHEVNKMSCSKLVNESLVNFIKSPNLLNFSYSKISSFMVFEVKLYYMSKLKNC